MAERKKQSLLNGAIILVISTLVVKVIGLCFKMPLGSMLGLVGYGYFTSVYAIYTPIYSISMAGLPIAVSRMVAEDVALNHYREARMTLKTARKIFLLVGTAGTLLMVIISIPYAAFISDIRNLPAMIAVAPSIFFCCYVSAYRGYYEGLRNMIPTAISQVIEALGKLVIGLVFAKLIMSYGESAYNSAVAAGSATATVFGKEVSSLNEAFSVTYPWAAAGAILGVTLGSLLSNATNLIDAVTIQNRLLHAIESGQDTIYNLYKQCIDADVASGTLNLSDSKGFMSYLYGAYNTAVDFKNLVPMITVSLGVSALPALAEAWTMKDKAAVKSAVNTVIRVSMLIALPAGIGMGVLAEPILTLIYGRGRMAADIPMIAPMVAVFGFTTAFMSISTPLTNLLQAVGRTDIPVKTMLVSAVVKIICNFALVGIPGINFNGAVIGTVLFYVINVILNVIAVIKVTKVRIDIMSDLIKPLISAAMCGLAAWAAYGLLGNYVLKSVSHGADIALLAAIIIAVIVYAIAIIVFKGIVREDIESLPAGEKIAKVLEKYELLG